MSTIKMNSFGSILTGREYGMNVAKKIVQEESPPYVFDFGGVISMGSSFGDEIFKAVIKHAVDSPSVQNANGVVRAALQQIQNDLKIELKFI